MAQSIFKRAMYQRGGSGEMTETIKLKIRDKYKLVDLFGEGDSNLHLIEKKFAVDIASRGNNIAITGDREAIRRAEKVIIHLYNLLNSRTEKSLSRQTIEGVMQMHLESKSGNPINIQTRRNTISPYTKAQSIYMDLIAQHDIVFGIGAAGTGKTYLAVAMAVAMFYSKKVELIILSRPAVEAGEKIGFLPGDIREKVDPYLRPLYDSLYEMIIPNDVERYIMSKEIEIAPLAFMRGRTLNNAFIILDEAQNTTPLQMKMFLTRLGHGSKMVVTGDLTQIDLPNESKSGLMDAINKLKDLPEVRVMKFSAKDVVRHPLTAKIIEAYEQN